MPKWSILPSWFAVASFICLGAISEDAVAGDEVTTVYYYNPDSNLTDYAGLKRVADGFLGQLGAFQFQPFRDGAVFDMHTLVNSDGITILPSWKFEYLREERGGFFGLEPQWVGTKNGARSDVRLVVALGERPEALGKLRIATSIASGQCMQLLEATFPGQLLESIEILSVPRDSDAGFAVLFGKADAAVVTKRTLDMLVPTLRDSGDTLKRWATTAPVMAPLVVTDASDGVAQKHADLLFRRMASHAQGRELLSLLGLDDWEAMGVERLNELTESGGE